MSPLILMVHVMQLLHVIMLERPAEEKAVVVEELDIVWSEIRDGSGVRKVSAYLSDEYWMGPSRSAGLQKSEMLRAVRIGMDCD